MKGWRETYFYFAVGAGMALATSVFTMIGGLFEVAGVGWVLAGIGVAGLVCIGISLSVAELASMYPSTPGIRTYLKAAFGDRASLVLVYLYLVFIVFIAGLEAFVFSEVLAAVFPAAGALPTIGALFAVVVAVNLAGFELPRGLQVVATSLCIGAIVAAGALGLFTAAAAGGTTAVLAEPRVGPSSGGLAVLPALVGMAVFLYMGFEWVTPLGLRAKSYERKIPLSMPTAVAVLAITYGLFAAGAATRIPRAELAATAVPQVPYFVSLFGTVGATLALALSSSAIFSTFNAGILGGSRLLFLLSREGVMPRWCATVWSRTGAPLGAILFLGGLALASAIAVVTLGWELLAAVLGAAIICVVYSAFVLAVLVLRRRRPKHRRPYRTPVPRPVQWVLAALLPAVGLATLLSQPSLGWRPVAGAVVSLAIALVATRASLSHAAARRPGVAAKPLVATGDGLPEGE